MDKIIDYCPVLVGLLALVAAGVFLAYRFFAQPTSEQIANVKEWLLWAVTGAEKELGGGTGKLKLRQVYDLFVQRFPSLAALVSFATFSAWVDEALVSMREMLNSNKAVKNLVEGEEKV